MGTNLAEDYEQLPKETLRAFLERIKHHFIQDLNTEWDTWPQAQRRNLVSRFLKGMVKEDFDHASTPKDRDALAEKSWPALLLTFIEVDRIIGPRARRLHRPKQQVSQANDAPSNPATWDTAKPHQQPATWGQGTVSMPTARSAAEPMSVNEMNQLSPHGEINRIRDGRCVTCCAPVPKEATHPDPCPQPPTCYNCMTPGHIRRDCPLPVAAANPGAQQPAAYQPPPLPEEEDTGAGTAANRTTTGHPQSPTSKLQPGQQQST